MEEEIASIEKNEMWTLVKAPKIMQAHWCEMGIQAIEESAQ